MSLKYTKVKSIEEQAKYVISQLNIYDDYLLLLSGGKTPDELYYQMANDPTYKVPRHVAQVDERWGHIPMHDVSNYKMIMESGFIVRMEREHKIWHPMLIGENTLDKSAVLYNSILSDMFVEYSGHIVGIFGMSLDGHIAGIIPDSSPITSKELVEGYVSEDKYKGRITMTISAIRDHVTTAVVLLNSKDKYESFKRILKEEKDVNKYPVLVFNEMHDVEVVYIPGKVEV
jgi:6-phosphogluconolactonase/glucosamine-6-phosphate isomerase/deaminase